MSNTIEKTEKVVGIYYVIGYGSDCDGVSAYSCVPFVSEDQAVKYCDNQNAWSDGVQYRVETNMLAVADYCHGWLREIPFARRTYKAEAHE